MPTENESSTPAVSSTPRGFCKACGYALVGLESRVCPECGRGFDPANRRTFARKPPRGWIWRWGKRIALLLLLLLLTAGAGMGCLWWGRHAEQPTIARLRSLRQPFTVAPIGPERLRWVLGKRWGYLAERVDWVQLGFLDAAETDALDFESLGHLQELRMYDCEISNSSLSRLASLKNLQELNLWFLKIETSDLTFLEKLPALSKLSLWGDWVGEAGIQHVLRLKHLKDLHLLGTGIKDADLQQLHDFASLEKLGLRRSPISDAGLEQLQGLKSLRVLYLDASRLDSPGVAKLKQAIPGLQVHEH